MTEAIARLEAIDERLLLALRCLPHHPAGDRALAALSAVTDRGAGWFALVAAGAVLDRTQRRRWMAAGLSLLTAEQLGVALKRRVPRPRPRLAGLPPLAGTPSPRSFPSTHTANAVAAAYTLGGVLPARLLWGLAALTAASRPYLGVHYPSDVVAGAALGALAGQAGRLIGRRR